jgi:hypothetical protein
VKNDLISCSWLHLLKVWSLLKTRGDSSLDALSESEIEALWLQEAAHRASQIDQGLSKLIPAEEVRRQANALLKETTS